MKLREKMRISYKKIRRNTRQLIRLIRYYAGVLFIGIGHWLVGRQHKYRLICYAIESVFQSKTMQLRVIKIIENNPLGVAFVITNIEEPISTFSIDYFIKELALKLACEETDIAIVSDDNPKYYVVSLTNTAITNMEKGTTNKKPTVFNKDQIDPLIDEATRIALSKQSISATLLQHELKIGYARAVGLLRQLEKLKILSSPDESKFHRILN